MKPLYKLVKISKNTVIWIPKSRRAFDKLKWELMRAPAVGLPDESRPFLLFPVRDRISLAVLAQHLGPYKRAVA